MLPTAPGRSAGSGALGSPPDPTPSVSPVPSQGYARIVFAIISFYFMPCCPFTASSFYLLSGLLDAFDGYAARILNQGDRQLLPANLEAQQPLLPFPASWGPEGGQVPWPPRTLSFSSLSSRTAWPGFAEGV